MVGVDDFDVAGRSSLEVASDTRRIVEALSPRKVVVQSVLLTSYPNLNGGITELNGLNRAYCATGACQYLELNDLFSRDGLLRPDMTTDGIHLVGKAYPLWAARVKALDRDP
jgi:lysophospholipase L1-like esterase